MRFRIIITVLSWLWTTKKIFSVLLRMNSNSHIIVRFFMKSFACAHGEIIHSVNCEILLLLVAM